MKFWISIIFNKTFLEQSIWICKWVSWWCHRLTIFHGFCSQKWRKSHTFQLRESKTCLISTMNNVCSGIFWYGEMLLHVWAKQIKMFKILYTQCMENCQAMTSSTHSFAHSYPLLTKCFTANYENSQFHIFLMFYPIYIKFSLFCSKFFTLFIHWINLNLDWISPLSPDERERDREGLSYLVMTRRCWKSSGVMLLGSFFLASTKSCSTHYKINTQKRYTCKCVPWGNDIPNFITGNPHTIDLICIDIIASPCWGRSHCLVKSLV